MASPIITIQSEPGIALTKQKVINSSNYPFTLNTTIGCLFKCRYCYLQSFPFNLHADFGNEIKIKGWLPEKLDRELKRKADLPQHLKRVQINPATEGYLPKAIHALKASENRYLMREVLEVFQKHWQAGNKWMLHLVTKSHLILRDFDLITEMRDQVQIELTITTLDKTKAKILEGSASSVARRLEVLQQFAKAGVFVRVMCMPFIGDHLAAEETRKQLIDLGAKGFKHKAMNYWDEDALLEKKTVRSRGKRDIIFTDLLMKSGEPYLVDGASKLSVPMPDKKWKSFEYRPMDPVDFGYREINSIDWAYIH